MFELATISKLTIVSAEAMCQGNTVFVSKLYFPSADCYFYVVLFISLNPPFSNQIVTAMYCKKVGIFVLEKNAITFQ